MKKTLTQIAVVFGVGFLIGCGVGMEDSLSEDSTGRVYEEGDAHVSSEESEGKVHALACLSSYDTRIRDAHNWIAQNCGGISACGTGENSTHSDIKLSNGDFCSCYSKLWNVRNSYPFNGLQVIYHEPQACSWNHIHLQVKNTCGILHFDLDEGSGDCYDNEPTSSMDAFFCGSELRKGVCNN